MKIKTGIAGIAMAGALGVFGVGAALANGDSIGQVGGSYERRAGSAQESSAEADRGFGGLLQQDGEGEGEDARKDCPREGAAPGGATPDGGSTPDGEETPDGESTPAPDQSL